MHGVKAEAAVTEPLKDGAAPSVLFIAGSQDARVGGPAFSAKNMWICARRAGIDATSVFPLAASPSAAEAATMAQLRSEGIRLHTFAFSSGRSRLAGWGMSLELALWLARSARRYDIIQAHGAWMIPSLLGLAIARLAGCAFVLVPHESMTTADVLKGVSPARHAIKRLVKSLYLRFSDALIVASALEARETRGTNARARCEVLYHPVFDDRDGLPGPRRWPDDMRELRVGFLGRFDPKKNIELLLEAAAATPRVSLDLAGAGPEAYERHLRHLAADRGLGDRVRWIGFVEADQKKRFFSTIDVLAMPSVQEGFGMVAAEAMSHGLPVIVSESSGIAELVERYRCGKVVPSRAEAVAGAFEQLLAEPQELGASSVRALDAIRQELAFSHYGVRLARIYRDLRSRRAANRRGAPSAGEDC